VTLDDLGWIVDRSDCDDPRGYPDPREELAAIERYARIRGRDVLEVGCGNGRLTVELSARARSVVAIEPHAGLLATARRRLRRLGRANVRLSALPAQRGIRGGPFHAIVFSWSLC
jgi:protein-L-isoaspartate O-methyltransferase